MKGGTERAKAGRGAHKVPPKRAADRIRETAADLFYRQGIRAVGVDEIVNSAGVTKPSLYRSFASKDELATAYLRDFGQNAQRRFEKNLAERPQDPRGQFRQWLQELSVRAAEPGYRGCGVTNASVEYPERSHPAHEFAAAHKRQVRKRLAALAETMGARRPDRLADALMLLIEGACVSGQLFGADGPSRVLVDAADVLIDAHLPPSRRRVCRHAAAGKKSRQRASAR